jgi:glycosyltransferase involved in cell wall biosynthesis
LARDPVQVCFACLQARGAFVPQPGVAIGGAEVQIKCLADYLAATGRFAPSVIVEDQGQPEREDVGGVTLARLTQPPPGASPLIRARRLSASALSLWSVARGLRADAYVQQCAGAETGIVCHAAHAAGAPFLFMMANDNELEAPWSRGGGAGARLFRHGFRRADLIVCQSELQREGIGRVFGRRDGVVIPNPYAFAKDDDASSSLARDGGPASQRDAGLVLWLARCAAQKQPLQFVDLARRLPGVRFRMVANPTVHEPELFRQVQEQAAALPNLELIPGAPHDRVPAIMREAGVFVSTSAHEGFPNTFLEAANAGLALASLRIDPCGMFSRDGAGELAGGDMDRLAEIVGRLANDAEARDALARHGRSILVARHDVQVVGAQFAQAIEQAIARRCQGGRS